MFFDESRFGTHSKIGHGWFKKGTRTPVPVKLGFKNFYLYTAASPRDGTSCTLLLPMVNTECMNIYLKELSQQNQGSKILLVMDGAGWHKSAQLEVPENIKIIHLPTYSPELNPVEKLWQYIKDHTIVNRVYESLEILEKAVCEFVAKLKEELVKTICASNYL